MDLLYSRYASPKEFMKTYIENGRFGEFVEEILEMEYKRKKEEEDKENDRKLWEMFLHSESRHEMSFNDWKAKVLSSVPEKRKFDVKKGTDADMTDADIEKLINRLFPEG